MASTLKNLAWKFTERVSAQLVQLVVSIILARILSPSDYGAVAMVTVFILFSNVIIEGGFSSALIQKKNADDLDFSTVLYFSIGFAIFLYAVLFISAPYISAFYGEEYQILTPVLRVLGIQVLIYAVNSVQYAYVQKMMMFKNFFWATLVGTVTSAVVGLVLAYSGYGVWAIVWQQLTANVINTLTLFAVTRKLPIMAFSLNRLKGLFNYGIKLFGAHLLITVYQDIRSLIIGKLYSAQDLAFFDRAKHFPSLIVMNINSSIGAVLFPKMSKEQDDIEQVKNSTRKSIRFSSYVMSPLMFGLAAIAEPFIRLVLTEKWIESAPLMQWFCIVFLFMPIHTANMQAIKAIGKSGTVFNLELIKKVLELVTLIAVMHLGVDAIVINMAIMTTLFTVVNAYPNTKYLGYKYTEQISDIIPSILMSILMFVIITGINAITEFNDLVTIIIDMLAGTITYVAISIIIKNREFRYITNLIRKSIKR